MPAAVHPAWMAPGSSPRNPAPYVGLLVCMGGADIRLGLLFCLQFHCNEQPLRTRQLCPLSRNKSSSRCHSMRCQLHNLCDLWAYLFGGAPSLDLLLFLLFLPLLLLLLHQGGQVRGTQIPSLGWGSDTALRESPSTSLDSAPKWQPFHQAL